MQTSCSSSRSSARGHEALLPEMNLMNGVSSPEPSIVCFRTGTSGMKGVKMNKQHFKSSVSRKRDNGDESSRERTTRRLNE